MTLWLALWLAAAQRYGFPSQPLRQGSNASPAQELVSPAQEYLIPEDSGVVVHVNATDLHEGSARVGPTWSVTGTAPAYIGPQGTTPPQVGPFTSGQFELPIVNPLNFAGSFSGCAVYIPNASDFSGNHGPFSDGFFSGTVVSGFAWQVGIGFRTALLASASSISGGTETAAAISISQWGYNAANGTIYAQVNGHAIGSLSSASYGPNTVAHALIGAVGGTTFLGTVIEFYATTTPPSAALFTAIYQAVEANL